MVFVHVVVCKHSLPMYIFHMRISLCAFFFKVHWETAFARVHWEIAFARSMIAFPQKMYTGRQCLHTTIVVVCLCAFAHKKIDFVQNMYTSP